MYVYMFICLLFTSFLLPLCCNPISCLSCSFDACTHPRSISLTVCKKKHSNLHTHIVFDSELFVCYCIGRCYDEDKSVNINSVKILIFKMLNRALDLQWQIVLVTYTIV